MRSGPESAAASVTFNVWGCRGTRNLDPEFSRIGVKTSCYSLLADSELVVFDAGKGLLQLAQAVLEEARFAGVQRVRILLSHSHMEHWEGLKDAVWFWRRLARPLEVTLYATTEALGAVRSAFAHPSFVPLETLAAFNGVSFSEVVIASNETLDFGALRVDTLPLNHYIGQGEERTYLQALGFLAQAPGGATVSYACDHEPDPGRPLGLHEVLLGASLMVLDSYYSHESEQGFGHGSMEYAARIARAHPRALVVAGHLGPQFTDETIIATVLKHAGGIRNCRIAREGDTYFWQEATAEFVNPTFDRLSVTSWPAPGRGVTPGEVAPHD